MSWIRKGLIYCPDGSIDWMNNSVLTPHPFMYDDDTIRIYASFRDKEGMGRIGYIDLDAKNPKNILGISKEPVIDIGRPGTFNDNGMHMGEVIRVGDKVYMYYVGFQLVKRVKHFCFNGLAISEDGGTTFKNYQEYPIMDRSDEGLFGRCIHTVIQENGVFRTWYATVYDWRMFDGKPYPVYDIRYCESSDGIHFPLHGQSIFRCGPNEYRIGRPRVRKLANGKYEMRFTFDTINKEYRSGYAESDDGINWVRMDEKSGLINVPGEFDSETACYPCVQETKYGTYMFYDGNNMGRAGFGYMEWED